MCENFLLALLDQLWGLDLKDKDVGPNCKEVCVGTARKNADPDIGQQFTENHRKKKETQQNQT